MTAQEVLHRIERKLITLDAQEARHGLPPIDAQDLTWQARHREIILRLAHLLDGPPHLPELEVALAHGVALMVAADRAEQAQPHTGTEAAA